MLLCIINTSSHSALHPALYIPTSVMTGGACDNDAMTVSVLHDSMMRDRYTLCIEEYMLNRL